MSRRRGVTLVELLVALALLGLMAGIVSVSWQPTRARSRDPRRDSIVAARRLAIKTGAPVSVIIDSATTRVLVLPNGLVLGAQNLGIEPLSGRGSGAPRP